MYSQTKFNLCLATEDTLKFCISKLVAMAIEKSVSFQDSPKF